MATVQAKTVRPGKTILHPDTRTPLRVVEPKNFCVLQGVLLPVGNNTVFAVDDEGGLYAIRPDRQVEVPFGVPLITQEGQDNYIVVASFERQLSDDLPTMKRNFREGKITADPKENLPLAAMQQLALEMGVAYDEGMAGFFQCHHFLPDRVFDRDAMGWQRRS